MEIRSTRHSLRELNKLLGFEVRNILYKNKSINENQLIQFKKVLNLNFKSKEIEFDYARNLGIYASTDPLKKIRKCGELAEFIGIMLGDGNIYRNRIKIAFDKRNEKYLSYVERLFENLFGVKFKKTVYSETNQAYLYYYNKRLIEKLILLGLKRGHKIKKNIGIPGWIKENKNYVRRCIKGLIDTDGCIYFSKRDKQKYIKFTNFNRQLLEDFKKTTSMLNYSFVKANKNNWCLYRKDEVARFIKEIKPLKNTYGIMG